MLLNDSAVKYERKFICNEEYNSIYNTLIRSDSLSRCSALFRFWLQKHSSAVSDTGVSLQFCCQFFVVYLQPHARRGFGSPQLVFNVHKFTSQHLRTCSAVSLRPSFYLSWILNPVLIYDYFAIWNPVVIFYFVQCSFSHQNSILNYWPSIKRHLVKSRECDSHVACMCHS